MSIIVWAILKVPLPDSAYPVWYPLYGSWIIILLGDIVLTVLSVIYRWPTSTLDILQLVVGTFRICLLLSMLLFLFRGRCTRGRYSQDDEENQPLLVSSRVQGPSEDSGATLVSTQYGSISGGESGAGSTDWEARDKERERKARKRVEDRLRDDGNWWTYAKGFSVSLLLLCSLERIGANPSVVGLSTIRVAE